MSRLASFRGPSTPSSSPVQFKQQNTPLSPSSRSNETTYHRKLRSYLKEIRSVAETWDELVLIDGLKAARTLVDTRTELENALSIIPNRLPRTHIVGKKLAVIEQHIVDLEVVVSKLRKQFQKMNAIVENLEALLIEASTMKGWKWVHEQPLWATWSLEKFVTLIGGILIPYHRSLHSHIELVTALQRHSSSFEASRDMISKWVEQPWLEEGGWDATWEDLCAAEIDRWDNAK